MMELFDLHGKVAIVTGGNGGLGRGMATGLARAGADIVIAARNQAKTAATATEPSALGSVFLGALLPNKKRKSGTSWIFTSRPFEGLAENPRKSALIRLPKTLRGSSRSWTLSSCRAARPTSIPPVMACRGTPRQKPWMKIATVPTRPFSGMLSTRRSRSWRFATAAKC